MLNTMDNGTQAMTGFFDVLSSVIDPEFSRIDSKQKQREILRLMEEWIRQAKYVREIGSSMDCHSQTHSRD
jgi:hypothetical protein